MAFNILAINPGHNGSAALISDGEIVFYGEEERFSKMKYDGNPFMSMLEAIKLGVEANHAPSVWRAANAGYEL